MGLCVIFCGLVWPAGGAAAKSLHAGRQAEGSEDDEGSSANLEKDLFEARDSLNNKVSELEDGQDVLIEKLRAQIEANQILEAEKEELEDLLKEYRAKKHSINENAGAQLKGIKDELEKAHEKYRQDVDKLSAHAQELVKLNQKYRQEFKSVEKTLNTKDRKITDFDNQIAQAKTEFAKLTAQNQALKGELEKLKADSTKSQSQLQEELNKKLKDLESSNQKYEQQIQSMTAAAGEKEHKAGETNTRLAETRADFEKLGAENQALKAEVDRLKAESMKSQSELGVGLNEKIKELEALNQKYEEQVKSFAASLADKDKKVSDVQAELAAAKTQFEKFSSENQTLKVQLDQLKTGSVQSQAGTQGALDKKIKEFEDLNRKFSEVQAENQVLKTQMDKLETAVNSPSVGVQQDLAKKIKELEGLGQRHQEEIKTLTESLTQAKAEANRLSAENLGLKKSAAAPIAAANAVVVPPTTPPFFAPAPPDTDALVKNAIADAEAKGAVLAKELAKLKASESDYLSQIGRLENEGRAKDDVIVKLRQQAKQVKIAESGKQELEKHIRETEVAEQGLAQKVSELERLNQKYLDQVKALADALGAKDKTIAAAESTATQAKAETARLASENEALKYQSRKLKENYETLLSELEKVRAANAKGVETARQMQEEAKRNNGQRTTLQKVLKSSVRENNALKKKLEEINRNIQKLASKESDKEVRKSAVSVEEIARRLHMLSDEAAICHYNLGVLFMKQGQHTEATGEFERTIWLNPSHAYARYNLAVLYDTYLGNPDKAVTYYEDYIRLLPKASDAKKVEYRLFQLTLNKEQGIGRDIREK